jgi:hypothetical protein
MVNKRNKELDNGLKRIAQRLKDAALLPATLGSLYFTGTVFTGLVGGVMPAVAAGTTGASLYGAIKLLSKKNRLKMKADTLKALNTLIKKTDDPNILFQLKADRLLLLDLMQQDQGSEEDE